MTPTLPLHVETLGLDPGEGVDTFVLVHGYGGSIFSWRYWGPRLAVRGHVVLVDLKGFGAAPRPDDDRYGPQDQAELLHRLLVERDLRRVTLIGHSLGGGVVLLTALRLLEERLPRLARLVIVAGAAYRQRLPPFVRLAHHPRLGRLLMRLVGSRRIVRRVLQTIVFDPTRISTSQIDGYAQPLAMKGAYDALVRSALYVVPEDVDDLVTRYRNLDVPALLLWGRNDPVVPLAIGQRLAGDLPDAALVVLDSCGHLPAEELPEASAAALEEFLDRTGGSRIDVADPGDPHREEQEEAG